MSLKENMQMVKEELSAEERMFESAVRTETFLKKYKKQLIAAIVVIIAAIAVNYWFEYQESQTKAEVNTLFNTLSKDPSNQEALTKLKTLKPNLYQLLMLAQASETNDTATLQTLQSAQAMGVADIAQYESAVIAKDETKLASYSLRQDAFYREFAILESALLLIKRGNIKEAHKKLELIASDSELYKIARILKHYKAK